MVFVVAASQGMAVWLNAKVSQLALAPLDLVEAAAVVVKHSAHLKHLPATRRWNCTVHPCDFTRQASLQGRDARRLFSGAESESRDASDAVIVILGFGSGVSAAVARRFGDAGYRVAIVSRTLAKLESAVMELREDGIAAGAFVADLSDPGAIRSVFERLPAELGGTVRIIHHNANFWPGGDFVSSITSEALQQSHAVCSSGLVVAVQAAMPQLTLWPPGTASVLVTNGGAGLASAAERFSHFNAGGALCNSDKMQTVRLLAPRLASEGVYLGEVVIAAGVAHECTPGHVCAEDVADTFWQLHAHRDVRSLVLWPGEGGPQIAPTDSHDCSLQPPSSPFPGTLASLDDRGSRTVAIAAATGAVTPVSRAIWIVATAAAAGAIVSSAARPRRGHLL